jgi:hypothetical protein
MGVRRRFASVLVAATALTVVTVLTAAAGPPPAGALVDIGGPGACVAEAASAPGLEQHTPAVDGCAEGRGLQELHHVALSPDGRFVYTAAGSPTHDPGDQSAVAILSRDSRTGSVQQLPGQQGCVEHADPPRDLGCTLGRNLLGLRYVVVSADGRFVYATGATGLAMFRRDTATGTLTQLDGEPGCISETTPGCLRAVGARSVEDLVITRKGARAYSASTSGFVLLFARDPRTGTLRPLGCIGETPKMTPQRGCSLGRATDKARSVTLSPDERFVYVADLSGAVGIFSRNPRSGWLTQAGGTAGCISETGLDSCAKARGIFGAHRLTITPDGRFAYLAGKTGGNNRSALSAFSRDPASGALTQLPGTAGCFTEDGNDGCSIGRVITGAHQALLDAAGRTLYLAADQFQGGVAIFRRNVSTGALSQLPARFGCLSPVDWEGCMVSRRMGGLHYLVLSRDGRYVYAAGEKAQALVVLRVVSPVPFPPSASP